MVLVGDALEIIPTLEGSFNMIFLDAVKHQYLDYLRLVEERLCSWGVVVADNVGFMSRSMRGYLDQVRDLEDMRACSTEADRMASRSA